MADRTSGPIVVRRRLGSELRRIREEANLRLEAVAHELEVSPSKLSRLENGQAIPKVWDVRNLLTLYGVQDEKLTARLLQWASEGKAQGWWQRYSGVLVPEAQYYLSLETEAAEILIYSTPVLHALVQTREYARAFLSGLRPELDGESVEQLVELRMRRQEMTRGSTEPPRLRVAVDEASLFRIIGSPEVMERQISALLDLPDGIELRIYRLSTGSHPLLFSPLTIFIPRTRDLDPIVVNVEAAQHEAFFENRSEVNQFQRMFDDLWGRSETVAASKDFLRSLLK